MTQRLSADIRKLSYWKLLYVVSFFAVLLCVLITLSLPLWINIFILIASLFVMWLSTLRVDQPIHIHAPDSQNLATRWQLIYVKRGQEALWEADLIHRQHLGHCVQLVYETVHPLHTKKTVVIWQDQVDAEVWRQLMVLSVWA